MKRVTDFIKRDIAGEIVLVPTGETAQRFNGMITLTETGDFIWEHIEQAKDFDNLVEMILDEYDIDKKTASADAIAFVMQLLKAGMIRPEGTSW